MVDDCSGRRGVARNHAPEKTPHGDTASHSRFAAPLQYRVGLPACPRGGSVRAHGGVMKMKQFTLTVLATLVLANYAEKANEQEAIEWQRYEQAAADEVNARCPTL